MANLKRNVKRVKTNKRADQNLKRGVSKDLKTHKLEDYKPGVTRKQFLQNLRKVATTPKSSRKT